MQTVPQQMIPAGYPGQQPGMMGFAGPRPPMSYYGQVPPAQFDLIGAMSGMNFGGQQPRPQTQGPIMNKQQRKEHMNALPSLYVSNLPKENFFDLDFYKFFTSRGFRVKHAKIVIDSKTMKSRGYGYLQFTDKEEAQRCLDKLNNQVLNGQALRIVHSVNELKFDVDANLLVKNIDKETTQQEIFDMFKAFGSVESCKLETYPNSKESRGYAYVQFAQKADAEKAIEALNGKEYKGKKLEVSKLNKDKKKDPKQTG